MVDTATAELVDDSLEGHYAGPITRLLAYLADGVIATFLYSTLLGSLYYVWNALAETDLQPPASSAFRWIGGYALWLFLYNVVCWSVWWKTPGKALLGLRIVKRDGSDLTAPVAWKRAIVYPLSFVVAPLGLAGVVVGRERRALHDVLAGTTVVYDWNARRARWRLLARRGDRPLDPTT